MTLVAKFLFDSGGLSNFMHFDQEIFLWAGRVTKSFGGSYRGVMFSLGSKASRRFWNGHREISRRLSVLSQGIVVYLQRSGGMEA